MTTTIINSIESYHAALIAEDETLDQLNITDWKTALLTSSFRSGKAWQVGDKALIVMGGGMRTAREVVEVELVELMEQDYPQWYQYWLVKPKTSAKFIALDHLLREVRSFPVEPIHEFDTLSEDEIDAALDFLSNLDRPDVF